MSYEQGTATREELNFYGTEDLVEIKPNFHYGVISLISGKFGPFRPNKIIEVPLWIAIDFKKRGKCYFEIPNHYTPEELRQLVKIEDEFDQKPAPLPYNFFQHFQLLEENASDQFHELKLTKSLVDELRQKRNIKIQNIMKNLSPEMTTLIQLDNFTKFEVHMFKNMIGGVLSKYRKV